MTRLTTTFTVVAGLLLVPALAAAQTPAVTASTIEAAVSFGNTVEISTKDGLTRKGQLFSVSATTLELMAGTRKETIAAADISLIRLNYRDSIKDGAKKGALTGLVLGAGLGLVLVASTCGGDDDWFNFCSPGGFLLFPSLFGGWGAGFGAVAGLIGDSARSSSRIVWRAPATDSRVAFRLVARQGTTGARVVISW
jgi:hypothetical protein